MDRRTFLKAAGFAGLSLATPLPWRQVQAKEIDYNGKFFVTVHAVGGWDPTSICDPKGRSVEYKDEGPINHYGTGEIDSIGNFNLAPFPFLKPFFRKYKDELLVINGIDTSTNGHRQGRRHVWSGSLNQGHPSLPSLLAAAKAPELPMSFISNGGFDATENLVPITRLEDPDVIPQLAETNKIDVDDSEQYHSSQARSRIQKALKNRAKRDEKSQHLPHADEATSTLYTARLGSDALKRLEPHLPDDLGDNDIEQQAKIAIAAYKAGLSVSANLQLGGFDTHSGHDEDHPPLLRRFFNGLEAVVQEAERQNVADQLVLIVGSDFGRTPHYNNNNDGKDHWPITSMMFMGPGIPGNRVIGATDDLFEAKKVDPNTLKVSNSGITIEPKHIHRAIRSYAGVDDHKWSKKYAMDAKLLPFFS